MATAATQHDPETELAQAVGEVSQTVTLTVKGKGVNVTVQPFGLRALARVLKCVQRMRDAGAVKLDRETVEAVKAAGSAAEAAKSFDFFKMLLDGGEEIINILSIAVGGQVQAQALDNLNPLDGARLASAVFAVNVDFFYQNKEELQAALAPAVKAVENVATKGVEALGQPSLTTSSEPDTSEQMS